MGRWVQIGGRQRWDPNGERTPEEWAQADKRVKEEFKDGKPCGAAVWNTASTIQSTGEEMTKAEFEAFKKERGYVEVDKGDTSVRQPPKKTKTDVARAAVEEAKAYLARTDQLAPLGAPTSAKTLEKLAKGEPIVKLPSASGEDYAPDVETPDESMEEVSKPEKTRLPWGYVGDKDSLIAAGMAKARERHDAVAGD